MQFQHLNQTSKKALAGKIPYTEFCQKPVAINYLRRFGCLSHVLKNTKMTKFEGRTMKGFLVGCNEDSYTILEAETGKFWKSKNVDFIETKVYGDVFKKTEEKSVLKNEGSEQSERNFWREPSEQSACRLVNDLNQTEVN